MPVGKVLSGVLLGVATKHYRLEDMSYHEPAYWLRDHTFTLDGQPIERRKGQPIGQLGAEWRAARRKNRALFYAVGTDWSKTPTDEWKPGAVRAWFAPKATEDTIIASFLTDLAVEEGYAYTMKTVDCVASEHSEFMELHNFMNNSIVHCIGMRQTAKTQVTDIREAVIGKCGGEKVKQKRRRLKRLAGHMSGEASDLTSDKEPRERPTGVSALRARPAKGGGAAPRPPEPAAPPWGILEGAVPWGGGLAPHFPRHPVRLPPGQH